MCFSAYLSLLQIDNIFVISIVQIKYKEEIRRATTISDPPELRRVKENQKNISNVCPVFISCTILSAVLNVFVSVVFVLLSLCPKRPI